MTEGGRKRCLVAYATRERQYLWAVVVPVYATDEPDVPWETAPVGIFGQLRERSDCPAEGDRVEIYRPLPSDPRDKRRERVQKQRKAGGK
jgi:putative ubiquitin-RnfH superfamily antitoxin RatB of RatAB toxin-antitoxin module